MGRLRCEVVGCTTRDGKEFQLFPIPKTPKTRETWLMRINRANFKPELDKRYTVCSKHFKPEDFVPEDQNVDSKGRKRKKPQLKKLAAPSLYMRPTKEVKELDKKTRHQRAKRTEFFDPAKTNTVKPKSPGLQKFLDLRKKSRAKIKWIKDPIVKWCHENLAVVRISTLNANYKQVTHVLRDGTMETTTIKVLKPPSVVNKNNKEWSDKIGQSSKWYANAVFVPNSSEADIKQEVQDDEDPLAVDSAIELPSIVKTESLFEPSIVNVKIEPTIDIKIEENLDEH